jgi:hypothetical protein
VCSQEERQRAALERAISSLPAPARDALAVRRLRQRLMATLNESVIELPRTRPLLKSRLALALAFALAGTAVVSFEIRRPPARARESNSFVEIRPQPGARWSEHIDREMDRVDLLDGTASFVVHPHQGRRVVVRVPDGELEDIGTVFEVRVAGQRTRHISVTAGRVSVRLRAREMFSLGAGEVWEPESDPHGASAESRPPGLGAPVTFTGEGGCAGVTVSAVPAGKSIALAPRKLALRSAEPAVVVSQAAFERAPEALHPPVAAESVEAEDAYYLRIIELLKRGEYAEARRDAKTYLLVFPNGFRRLEVLNIATRSLGSDPEQGSSVSNGRRR